MAENNTTEPQTPRNDTKKELPLVFLVDFVAK